MNGESTDWSGSGAAGGGSECFSTQTEDVPVKVLTAASAYKG